MTHSGNEQSNRSEFDDATGGDEISTFESDPSADDLAAIDAEFDGLEDSSMRSNRPGPRRPEISTTTSERLRILRTIAVEKSRKSYGSGIRPDDHS